MSQNVVDYIYNFSQDIMKKSKWVEINDEKVEKLAKQIKKVEFKPLGYPEAIDKYVNYKEGILAHSYDAKELALVVSEIVASSINYCYWYGRSDFKPNNIGANLMYDIVYSCMPEEEYYFSNHPNSLGYPKFLTHVYSELVNKRFPLLEERHKHLLELSSNTFCLYPNLYPASIYDVAKSIIKKSEQDDAVGAVEILMNAFPGFASDVFSKRAILCISLLNRRKGMFKDSINKLPIPADYQVPKMLRWKGCLIYHPSLEDKVDNDVLIPKGSLEELEIRAASIVVCKMISELSGVTQSDIDAWLWGNRKECTDKFHLTITTDY